MSKKEIAISVEGQTEGFFARYVLSDFLDKFDIKLLPPAILGGNITVERVARNLSILADYFPIVTSMYDFYGFVDKLEGETKDQLINRILKHPYLEGKKAKILPYIQMYEFEALLFSDPYILCNNIFNQNLKPSRFEQCLVYFDKMLEDKNPEEVNDSIKTASSKRILNIFHGYSKTIYGHLIAKEIGINTIKDKCPNFNNWLNTLISM